jgi:hypothetical protein
MTQIVVATSSATKWRDSTVRPERRFLLGITHIDRLFVIKLARKAQLVTTECLQKSKTLSYVSHWLHYEGLVPRTYAGAELRTAIERKDLLVTVSSSSRLSCGINGGLLENKISM